MSNLLLRGLTGIVFIASIILPIYFDWRIAVSVFLVYYLAGAIEYANLFKKHPLIELSRVGLISLLVLLMVIGTGSLLEPKYKVLIILIFPVCFVYLLTELWRKKKEPIINIGVSVLGIVYLFIPFYILIHFIEKTQGEWIWVLGMFFLIWTNDTFAYLTGRLFGKNKLFERISPKKTWEGTIGGIVFTFGVAFLIFYLSGKGDLLFWMVSAAVIAPSAILGDLLESLMKRNLNIKDSGNILPGHGGILDRFDASLFAIPFYFCWYILYSTSFL